MNPNWALRLLSANVPMERMVAERERAKGMHACATNILHFQMRITIILGHLQNTLCYENKTNCYCISDTDGRSKDPLVALAGWLGNKEKEGWLFPSRAMSHFLFVPFPHPLIYSQAAGMS